MFVNAFRILEKCLTKGFFFYPWQWLDVKRCAKNAFEVLFRTSQYQLIVVRKKKYIMERIFPVTIPLDIFYRAFIVISI